MRSTVAFNYKEKKQTCTTIEFKLKLSASQKLAHVQQIFENS